MLLGAHLIFANALALPLTDQLASSGVEGSIAACLIGFASHHLGDLLPHVDSNLWPRDFDRLRDWPPTLWLLAIGEFLIGAVALWHFNLIWRGREVVVLATSFGAILPDLLSHTPIKYILARTQIGQSYMKAHKYFHFRPYGDGRYRQLALAVLIEAIVISFSFWTLASFV